MLRRSLLSLLGLGCVAVVVFAAPPVTAPRKVTPPAKAVSRQEATPARLYSQNPNLKVPMWLRADQAIGADGLRVDFFRDADVQMLHDLIDEAHAAAAGKVPRAATDSIEPEICFGERPAEIGLPDASLPDLVRSSRAIYSGTIEEVTPGFFEGIPASLLKVHIEAAPRASREFNTRGNRIFVYYPSAVLRVGGDRVCTRPATQSARPKPGDRILVFALAGPADTDGLVIYPQASRHLIFETADGQLLLPAQLQRSLAGFSSLAAIEKRVEFELGAHKVPRPPEAVLQ